MSTHRGTQEWHSQNSGSRDNLTARRKRPTKTNTKLWGSVYATDYYPKCSGIHIQTLPLPVYKYQSTQCPLPWQLVGWQENQFCGYKGIWNNSAQTSISSSRCHFYMVADPAPSPPRNRVTWHNTFGSKLTPLDPRKLCEESHCCLTLCRPGLATLLVRWG